MQLTAEQPYRIESLDGRRAVLRFNPITLHERTTEHEEETKALVRSKSTVACDVSEATVSTRWIRWLVVLSLEARNSGKVFTIVGADSVFETAADVIGVRDTLDFAGSVEEVWDR